MLAAFASVGARAFNLTLTDSNGEKVFYRPNRPLEELRRTIDRILQDAERNRHNVIIRPRSTTATLIQLDDLDFAKAERIAPRAFIVFQTSPANYQAWVAVEQGAPEDFRRRFIKGIGGADDTASASTRIAGSLNFKTKYAPAFPVVAIIHANPGNVTSTAQLESAGFVAPAEEAPRRVSNRVSEYHGPRKWPSYKRCLDGAPPVHNGDRPDISKADFVFCMTAIDWGWSVEDAAKRLMEESSKAQENGEGYALTTAKNAAAAVDRERGRRQVLKSPPAPRQ